MNRIEPGTDTIAAIATGVGSGGIGIVRISGDRALELLQAIFSRNVTRLKSHRLILGDIMDESGRVADEVMVCYMRKPKTYTREDVVEIHCHGGRQTLQCVLRLVLAHGARLAEPGEFTKRAFLNGRIDLSRAEAVIDVINAQTDLARRTAVGQLKGNLSETCRQIAGEILTMIAHIEASIDYPEHDLEEMNRQTIIENCRALGQRLSALIESANKGRIIRDGIETAIIGAPNVGKSSLLNFLLDEDRAIVTDIPGTTRDILRETVNIGGIPLHIIDTAGIRQTDDLIETIGVEKSRQAAENAELVLFMLDGALPLTDETLALLEAVRQKKCIILVNKADLPQKIDLAQLSGYTALPISIKAATGIEALYSKINDMFMAGQICQNSNETLIYNMRHKDALKRCAASLQAAMASAEDGLGEDFLSIDLQDAYRAIGEITGETLDEDIVDKIFQEFCLGK